MKVEWMSEVSRARRACDLAPDDGSLLNTLGAALFHTEEWQQAIDALQKSSERGVGVPRNWLLIAMAYWHLDDKTQSKQWYDKSLAWQTANQPAATADKKLQTFYAEAAKLLAPRNTPDPATTRNP